MKTWPSLISMFIEQSQIMGNKPYLWSKKDGRYESVSWRDSSETALGLAGSLKALGVSKGDRILLCSESRPEWIIAYYALMAAGGIVVPAYTTNTENT